MKTRNQNEALKFFEINDVPSDMKTLNTMYKRLVLKYHPDKNNGEERFKELFQELQEHYKTLGEIIKSQKAYDKSSDEDADEFQIFSHFNFAGYCDKKNLISHSIIIKRVTGGLWQTILERHYGPPEQMVNKDTGFKFKVKGFVVDGEAHNIFVTCFPRTKEPKLFIQSDSQYANDIYVSNELPILFSEVKKEASRGSIGVAGAGVGDAGVGPAAGLPGGDQEAAADSSHSGQRLRKSARQTSLAAAKTSNAQSQVDKFVETVVEGIADLSISGEETVDSNKEALAAAEDTLATEAEVDKQAEPEVTLEEVEDDGSNSEVVIPDLVAPDDPGDTQPEKEKHSEYLNIIEKLKCELMEAEMKVKDLDKKKKELEKEKKSLNNDMIEVNKMRSVAETKASSLSEENIKLREEIQILKNTHIADSNIKSVYETHMAACNKHREECEEYTARMEKHLEECQKAEDDEPDVLDIVRNKEAGHRQTSPASAPVPAPRTRRTAPPPPPPAAATASHTPPPFTPSSPPPTYEKCDLCSQVFHHQPAEGDRQALSPQQLLRCHLIAAHKIAGGALEKCAKCPSFSALNKAHLQIHLERGYRHQKKVEEKCNQCQYKSKDENLMKRHVGLKHKIHKTCKYWKSGSCV